MPWLACNARAVRCVQLLLLRRRRHTCGLGLEPHVMPLALVTLSPEVVARQSLMQPPAKSYPFTSSTRPVCAGRQQAGNARSLLALCCAAWHGLSQAAQSR